VNELNEDPAARARKYIATLITTFKKSQAKTADTDVRVVNVLRVTDAIQRYLQDAQHYLEEGRAATALASVAYAEGLLDALFFLELAQP
jgi:hypothetical protein